MTRKLIKAWEHNGVRCWVMFYRKEYRFDDEPLGYHCGYVELPDGHAWHEGEAVDYPFELSDAAPGGLTFRGDMFGAAVVGFDCNHYGDVSPDGVYVWDDVSVMAATERVADEMRAAP